MGQFSAATWAGAGFGDAADRGRADGAGAGGAGSVPRSVRGVVDRVGGRGGVVGAYADTAGEGDGEVGQGGLVLG